MTRAAAMAALGGPTLAGLAYLALFGAPTHYLAINAAALALAAAILFIGLPQPGSRARLVAGAILLALFVAPLVTGPTIAGPFTDGVNRWLPLGPFMLNAGMLAIPPLVVLAAHDDHAGPPALLAALLIALVQPDFASALALTGGAVGIYQVRGHWSAGLVVIAGFFIAISAALRGELPPEAFVERILLDAFGQSIAMGLLLALSLAGATLAMLFGTGLPRIARYPIGMTLFGFLLASMISTYPTPLAGYGAAAIIGFALAHALAFALPDAPQSPA
ncbi:MAG: hypothetical protein GW855_06835 [Erythrobacter sp.]|nr:hypothetical protein [Erythrobacter sp.]NCQ63144.1 hypothetical protein [Alphaproteobacteria bacterium]